DRAIDLYAVGVDEFSEPERRAAAYGLLIKTVITPLVGKPPQDQPSPCFKAQGLLPDAVSMTLTRIADRLLPDLPVGNAEITHLRDFVKKQAWPTNTNTQPPIVIPPDLTKFIEPQEPIIDIVAFILEIQQEFAHDQKAQERATLPQSLET